MFPQLRADIRGVNHTGDDLQTEAGAHREIHRLSDPVVVIGAGPAGLTAALPTGQTRGSGGGGGGRHGGRGASVARSNGTGGGSTSAVTASSPRCNAVEELWHEILPRRGLPAAPRMSRHLLRRQVLRLSAARPSTRSGTSGCGRRCSVGSPIAGPGSDPHVIRATTRVGWWPASDGACTGPSSRPTPRRSGGCRSTEMPVGLGGPAGQEPRSGQGRPERPAPRAQPDRHHELDRGVPVPEVRPRDDVGALLQTWSREAAVTVLLESRVTSDPPRATAGPPSVTVRYPDGTRTSRSAASHVISTMPITRSGQSASTRRRRRRGARAG